MAYNFAVKKYANGTVQLTYYERPILNSEDIKDLYNTQTAAGPKTESFFVDADYYERSFDDSNYYTPWGYEELVDISEEEDLRDDDQDNNGECISDVKRDPDRSLLVSINRTKHKIYDYGRNNIWDWFFTFTLSDMSVTDRKDYSKCAKKVTTWLKNIKYRKCPDMGYLVVPEKHPTSGAWHFHALVNNVDELTFIKAVNQQAFMKDDDGNIILNKKGQPVPNKYFGKYLRTSYPDGDYIYNVKDYGLGWSTATRVKDSKKAVSYIVKYITKDLAASTFGKRRFYPSKNLTLPERTLGMFDKDNFLELVTYIEYTYNVRLSTDYIKSISVFGSGFENKISYMEFEGEDNAFE